MVEIAEKEVFMTSIVDIEAASALPINVVRDVAFLAIPGFIFSAGAAEL